MSSLEFIAATVVPVLGLLFVGIIGFVNLFHIVRKRFPIRVNCWFCNTNSRVPYENHNSWFCPSCTQYNGFTEDGDYNREIPAQYQCRLNPQANVTDDDKISYSAPHNGLCFGCNRNQELKIHQLASFVPEDDENYDEEVEEYRRQLEQTYKLCSRCERVVKRTLNDVKRNILGSKLAQIGTKGLKVFDMHMEASDKQNSARRRKSMANACLGVITLLLLMKVVQASAPLALSLKRLEALFNPLVSQTVLIVVSYLVAIKDTMLAQWNGLMEKPTIVDSVQQLQCVKNVFSDFLNERVNFPENFPESTNMIIPKHILSNSALIGLAATLLAMKLHIGNLKPIIVIVCSFVEIMLRTESVRQITNIQANIDSIWLLVASISLVAALSCIGKTTPKVNPSDNVNSSFHKIYSQQANDADSSDAIDDNSTILQDASICSRKEYQPEKSSPNNLSARSMDTTKSISPSVLTASTFRPFLDNSFTSQVQSSRSHFGGSALNVNRLNTTFQEQSFRSISRQGLKAQTPSISVDNFHTAIAGPNDPSLGYGFSKYGFSTTCLNKSTLLEEDRFGDDIDRLSISGNMSVSRKDLTMVNNPFSTHHVDRDDGYSMRQRKVTISPPRLGDVAESGSSWLAGGYWKGSPSKNPSQGSGVTHDTTIPHPYMSRTSSQSSGFESQPTRRPTPEEPPAVDLDRVSLFSEPAVMFTSNGSSVSASFQQPTPRLNQTFHLPLPQSSPGPSSHVMFGNRTSSQWNSGRSLFGEHSLFQQPQQGSTLVPSAIFPPHHSQTPLFGANSNIMPSTHGGSFSSAESSSFSVAGQMGPKNGSRRSLLNLSKLGGLMEE